MKDVRQQTFQESKEEISEYKINELATNSKNKNIRDLSRLVHEFKKGYQPRNSLVRDENGDRLVYSNNILNM
jgi:hypothetical protein